MFVCIITVAIVRITIVTLCKLETYKETIKEKSTIIPVCTLVCTAEDEKKTRNICNSKSCCGPLEWINSGHSNRMIS